MELRTVEATGAMELRTAEATGATFMEQLHTEAATVMEQLYTAEATVDMAEATVVMVMELPHHRTAEDTAEAAMVATVTELPLHSVDGCSQSNSPAGRGLSLLHKIKSGIRAGRS